MEELRILIDRSKETANTYFSRSPSPASPANEEEISRVFTPTLRKVSALVPGDRGNNCMLELKLLKTPGLAQTPYRHVRVRKCFEKRYETRRKSGVVSTSPRAKRPVSAVPSRAFLSPRKPSSPRVQRARCLRGLITICDLATSPPKSRIQPLKSSPRINH